MEKDCNFVCGRQPDLSELSKFITAQSQIEKEPVYDREGESQTKFSVGRSTNKKAPEERAGPTTSSLATEIRTREKRGNQDARTPVTPSEQGSNESNHNPGEHWKVCNEAHVIPKCSVFLSKGVGWRRGFARFKALCCQCLSHLTVQKRPVILRWTVLVHKITTRCCVFWQKMRMKMLKPMLSLVRPQCPVYNATTENNRRSVVLLKVVPLRVTAENRRTRTIWHARLSYY